MVAFELPARPTPSERYRQAYDAYIQLPTAADLVTQQNIEALYGMISALNDQLAELRNALGQQIELVAADARLDVEIGKQLAGISTRVSELEQAVEDIVTGTGVARSDEPTVRTRISHAHTLKDGWRCDSTTVEVEGGGEPDWPAIRRRLRAAAVVGAEEAELRNTGATAAEPAEKEA